MDNFSFYTPTRYKFGRGSEELVGEMSASQGWETVMIVYGGGSAIRSGLLERVCTSLTKAGVRFVTFGGIRPNPTDGPVREAIDICRKCCPDAILAVGGGSVIDTAKAVAAGYLYSGDFWDFFSGKTPVEKALPIGVVLTIPAAGSEGSGNAVITNTETGQKISIRTESVLRPVFSLLNPELTFTLPAEQTAAGIVDMMAHIMERYFTTTEGVEVTDRISEGLLRAIMNEAPIVMAEPENYDARANIMWSGTMAHNGICGCGRREDWGSHGLEHVLSAEYGVTHGAGLATVFPAWMTFMASHKPAKVAQLGQRIFGISAELDPEQGALKTAEAMRDFFKSLGLPVNLKELGITDPDFRHLTECFLRDKGNPFRGYMTLGPEEVEAIYRLMV